MAKAILDQLREENCKIEISMAPVETSGNLESLVRQFVEERIALCQQEGNTSSQPLENTEREKMRQAEPSDSLEEDISCGTKNGVISF